MTATLLHDEDSRRTAAIERARHEALHEHEPGTWVYNRKLLKLVESELSNEIKTVTSVGTSGEPIRSILLRAAAKIVGAAGRVTRPGNDHRGYLPVEVLRMLSAASDLINAAAGRRFRGAEADLRDRPGTSLSA
jgi:hypothetical protein